MWLFSTEERLKVSTIWNLLYSLRMGPFLGYEGQAADLERYYLYTYEQALVYVFFLAGSCVNFTAVYHSLFSKKVIKLKPYQ